MAHFFSFLAVLSSLMTLATGKPVVDSRPTGAAAPFSPAEIINALGVGLVKDINAFITVCFILLRIGSRNWRLRIPSSPAAGLFGNERDFDQFRRQVLWSEVAVIRLKHCHLVKNPLAIELTLDNVSAVAGLNGTIFATFSHTFPFPGLVVPPLGTKNSGTINNVSLPQGAVASLAIIPFGILDLPDTNANIR